MRCIQYQSRHYSCHVTRKSLVYTHTCDQGCPQANRGDHFNPTSASTNPRQNPHSRVLRFPRTSPAGSFFGGFRTPAPAQAAPSRSAGVRNPAHKLTFHAGSQPTAPSSRTLVEQRLCLLQVQRVKALGEPALHWSEKLASLGALALLAPQARHQDRCTQFPAFRALRPRDVDCRAQACLCRGDVRAGLPLE